FRKGRRKVIQFEDVDIKCNVEKVVDGVKHPIAYIIRKANERTFREIHDEIRAAQGHDVDQRIDEEKTKKKQLNIMKFPKFIRNIIWGIVMRNPMAVKKNLGTIGVTALGMFGKGISGWAIPMTIHATAFALGVIVKKPVFNGDKIESRQVLHITFQFDHELVDGAPASRFCARLYEIMSQAQFLEEYE
ncbi:MAG: 2-oxo acid dehydrogenase subunit E2, partial [Candidatus Heimdallarchaeota archaeon]